MVPRVRKMQGASPLGQVRAHIAPKIAWDVFGTWPSYTVERIHHVMTVRGERRYHVQWKDIPESGWTWEPERHLQDDHSRALLEVFKAAQENFESVSLSCSIV